jgi:hypothetical protein
MRSLLLSADSLLLLTTVAAGWIRSLLLLPYVTAGKVSEKTSYTLLFRHRQQLRGGGSHYSHDDRALFWSNDINVTADMMAAQECAEVLVMSDSNGDGVVDWKEYVGFVQRLSVNTPHNGTALTVVTYMDLPLELQVTYNRLACYFCFNNDNNTIVSSPFRAALAPETLPPTRDECCIGLDTFVDTVANGTGLLEVDLLEEEDIMYLTQICEATVQAMDETWTNDNDITQGRLTTCPAEFNPGGDCSAYEDGLQCGYGHIYTGCTWEELYCQYIERCDCYDDVWSCLSLSMVPCGFDGQPVPEGLPWGEACDPEEPLPLPPPQGVVIGGMIP